MTKVYAIDGVTPVVHPSAYVHPSAVLIGDVFVGAGVYVGPLGRGPSRRRKFDLPETLPLPEYRRKRRR